MKMFIRRLPVSSVISFCLFVACVTSCNEPNSIVSKYEKVRGARTSANDPATMEDTENLSFSTRAEAEDYVYNQMNLFPNLIVDQPVEADTKSGTPCLGEGTYYVYRATYGLTSEVNVIYQRSANGTIQNVTSSVTGTPLYTWNQQAVTIFSKYSFCIDAIATFGIDIGGIPTNWSKSARIRVYLDTATGCKAKTQFKYGNCSQ
jgi:hypothetical protein